MQLALNPPQEDFVKQAVREGRFASESEVVNLSLRLLQENERKLADLRAMIAESLQDTSIVPEEELDQALEEQEAQLIAMGIPE